MELKPIISSPLEKVFRLWPDVTPAIEYHQIVRGGVDPDTGEAVAERVESKSVRMFADKYKKERVKSGDVTSQDIKGVFITSMLGLTPRIGDRVIHKGVDYEVFLVEQDPIGVTYELGLRA